MFRGVSNIYWLWLSAAVIAVDQISKQVIVNQLEWFERIAVFPHFNIVHLRNTGAAFGMFDQAPAILFIALGVVVSLGILWWLRHHRHDERLAAAGLSLILGGALGNVIDRAMRGHVVDFLDFYWEQWHFAAFNIADSAITVGAGLLILDTVLQARRDARRRA